MDEIHETAPTLEDLERRVAELETELADAKRRAAGSVDRLKSDTVDPDLSQSSIGSSEVRCRHRRSQRLDSALCQSGIQRAIRLRQTGRDHCSRDDRTFVHAARTRAYGLL
jgi:hypothetical protein